MARGIIFVFVISYLLFSIGIAHSQNIGAGLDTERFKPVTDSQGLIVTEAGRGENAGDLNLGFYLHYSKNSLVLNQGSTVFRNLISDRLAGNVRFSTGVSSWLTLGVDIPAVFYQDGSLMDQDTGESIKLAGAVLGDIRVIPKITLAGAKDAGVSLALLAPVTFPSGDESSFYGNRGFTVSPTLALSAASSQKRFIFAMNIGALLQEKSSYADIQAGNEAFYRVGIGVQPIDGIMFTGELQGSGHIANLFKNPPKETPLEGVTGVRFFIERDIIFTAGAALGILEGWGTPNYRVFGGFTWAPRKHDRDNDGISDDDDKCPTDFGPKENLGCPWGDKDSDGLLDNEDHCPSEFGPIDNRGCPWSDTDKDGTTDNVDKCLEEPGPKENQGCPWGDKDQDGILDNLDQCPEKAEDKDEFEDEDGCPDLDNDQDGISDNDDKCPNEPEVINGHQDDDGCPDEGKVVVIIKEKKIEILQKIHFATGKSEIMPDSFSLLDQVAKLLETHSEISLLRVDGHTDSQGPEIFNQKLSERRAASVRDYLINKGIKPERIQTKGFGESQPIDSNQTARGRENNRRVEFTILEKTD